MSALEPPGTNIRTLPLRCSSTWRIFRNQSRRNNLRGIPEDVASENLRNAVKGIFRNVLEDPDAEVELDRVHRALGPRLADPDRPWDVVCRLHHYLQKEAVVRRAWDHGDVALDGAHIKILPDLSRATLRRRAMLRPVLDLAKQKGFTSCWG